MPATLAVSLLHTALPPYLREMLAQFAPMRWSVLTTSLLALASANDARGSGSCRCFPGDECWPSRDVWSSFNASVDGRLIATVPLGTPCHTPNYDEAVCETLSNQWMFPAVQYAQSHLGTSHWLRC